VTEERHAPALGIGFMLLGMLCISLNDLTIKLLSGGYPLHQIVFTRSAVGLLLTLGMLKIEGGWTLLRTRQPGLHVLRALLVVFANSCFYAAIVVMPLATATALYFVAPLFVTLLSIPVLGEAVGPRRVLAVVAGFAGVLVMMAPQMEGGAGWAALLPVLAAAGYAGMSVLTRKLGASSRVSALAAYIQATFVTVGAGFWLVAGDGRFVGPETPESLRFLLRPWVWPSAGDAWVMLGLGVLSALVGYSMSQAYRLARASTVAPFEFMLLIYALIWGWAFLGEWPAPLVFAGAAVILAANGFVFWRENRQARRATGLAALTRARPAPSA